MNRDTHRRVSTAAPTTTTAAVANRCGWATGELYEQYHDTQWGVPLHDDRDLFEMLILEGAQAGLSWITILRKRPAYRQAFDQFDASKIARYDQQKCDSLAQDAAIVRNRLKIKAAVQNARCFLQVLDQLGSFDRYIWQFVDHQPIQNRWTSLAQLPTSTPQSQAMSRDLRRRGFRFVGPTICYAYMQATGMVNDHLVSCFRHAQLTNG